MRDPRAAVVATDLWHRHSRLGGAPRSHENLWPEPWSQAHKSDPRENAWHRSVCNGTLTLRQARHAELVYKRTHG